MKLLFDQNLSPKLAQKLSDVFPGSTHTAPSGLGQDGDGRVWDFARQNGFTIVTKDGDFADLLAANGFPPKIILIQLGNCATHSVEAALKSELNAIEELETRPDKGLLAIVRAD